MSCKGFRLCPDETVPHRQMNKIHVPGVCMVGCPLSFRCFSPKLSDLQGCSEGEAGPQKVQTVRPEWEESVEVSMRVYTRGWISRKTFEITKTLSESCCWLLKGRTKPYCTCPQLRVNAETKRVRRNIQEAERYKKNKLSHC